MLTRKHFEALAAEIRQIPDKVAREWAAHAVARMPAVQPALRRGAVPRCMRRALTGTRKESDND